MSKPVRCPVCNDELICHHSPAIAKSGFTAYMECLGCDIFFASRTAKTESGARRLAIKAAREWIAKLKTCKAANTCAFRDYEPYKAVDNPSLNGDVFPRPQRAPSTKRLRPFDVPGGTVIYGCGMPDTVVMYMASDPAVAYEHIPPTITITKITPEDLINGAAVTTISANSANITPVYSAPGNEE